MREQAELCAGTALQHLAADAPGGRKYAPDRDVDILHLSLDVVPDFARRTVAGKMTLKFKAISRAIRELALDAVDLEIRQLSASVAVQNHHLLNDKLVITFAGVIPIGAEASVTVEYTAQPRLGLYFRTPEMGYPKGETHLWTQGEAVEARHWYPCYDSPNEKFTSEVTCHVPPGMIVLSNGRKMSDEKDAEGLTSTRWLQEKPHANYLIALAAGYFAKVEERYRDIPMAFYTTPSQVHLAPASFADTQASMAFFETEIGVPYPWAKYDQVAIADFHFGGMENTSMTILTDQTLFTTNSENIRSSQGLVAHELAHQWFGDLVTCKDWSHLWLNEGFATYYSYLFDAHKNGQNHMLYDLYQAARGLVSRTEDTTPMVNRDYAQPDDMALAFGYLSYAKGAWILQMLRSQLGPELYRRCIKTYLERHQFGNVVTEDLNSVLEELSGRSFDRFFDLWVYRGGFPQVTVRYEWDEKTKLARLSLEQTQKSAPLELPIAVRFHTSAGPVTRDLLLKAKAEDFYFPLPEKPRIVRIDPELAVLMKVNFPLNPEMLQAQLENKDDMIGRVIAIDQLSSKNDHQSISRLKATLQSDSFHAVRMEAAAALRKIHSDEAYAALADSLEQTDARVRQQVVTELGAFYRPETRTNLARIARTEKNPEILSRALTALGAYRGADVAALLQDRLSTPSFRNILGDAAIRAMRAQEDTRFIPVILHRLKQNENEFTSSGIERALDTLAYLSREEKDKDGVREYLAGLVNDPRERVQRGALAALGVLQDAKALPVLEPFTARGLPYRTRQAAENAIQALRTKRPQSDELTAVRAEVLDLQKANRDLRRDFDALKKKIEATPPSPVAPPVKAKSKELRKK